MPTPDDILTGLSQAANGWSTVAIAWHGAIGVLLIALFLGWRPPRAFFVVLMTLPLLSVSLFAWLSGNPFNGIVFIAIAIAVAVLGVTSPRAKISLSEGGYLVVGLAVLGFGWVYPHFLESGPLWRYLYAAPIGLVPCPTVSAVVGLALVTQGLGSRAVSMVLAVAGLFYGLYGALWLGVHLDIGLAAGAMVLAILAFQSEPPHLHTNSAGAAGL